MYIGINDTAKKVNKAYIGIKETAKAVIKIYRGDENGKAKMIYALHKDLSYRLSADRQSAICTGIGTQTDLDIVISETYRGVPVKSISPNAFKNCSEIKSVVIPESITNIGAAAFEGCRALETIYFNAINMSDCTQDAKVFKYCGMNAENGTTLSVGSNVTYIPRYLFFANNDEDLPENNLTRLKFAKGSKCEAIGSHAFYACYNLADVEIPDSVMTIAGHAFRKSGITSVIFGKNSRYTQVNTSTFYKCKNLKEIHFPASLTGAISENIFTGCESLKTITLATKPREIHSKAFLNIPDSVKIYVPWFEGEFSGAPWGTSSQSIIYGVDSGGIYGTAGVAYKLNSDERTVSCIGYGLGTVGNITISIANYYDNRPVTAISNGAFENTDIGGVTIPENIKTLGTYAFAHCYLLNSIEFRAIDMSDCTEDTQAFAYCGDLYSGYEGNVSLYIGKDVTHIPAYLFDGYRSPNSLNTVHFEDVSTNCACIEIRHHAFRCCTNLYGDIMIPDSVQRLMAHCFRGAGMRSITFGENSKLYLIWGCAFAYSYLETFTVPGTVKEILNDIFTKCEYLYSVTFCGIPYYIGNPTYNNSAIFLDCIRLSDIYVPWSEDDAINAYAPWGADDTSTTVIHYNHKTV